MNNENLRKQKLIAEITEAFKDVQLENGVGLSEADAIDRYASIEERATCKQNDEKQKWNLIPSSSLNKYYCSLSFFDSKGMQFHLPTFLIAEINQEYKFGMSFPLTHLSDYTKSQFSLLTKEQRHVVKLFLEYLLENEEYKFERPTIKEAINNYWSK